ncbi:hypothetical protein HMI55_002942, partial [Coelomomyces lativittatus]
MKLSNFDVFTKVDDSFLQRSTSGGWFSIVIFCIMGYLTLTETLHYWSPHQHHEFRVDPLIKQVVKLSMDLTIHMPCKYLKIDSYDTSGAAFDLSHAFEKIPSHFSIGDAVHYGELLKKRNSAENLINFLNSAFVENEGEDENAKSPSLPACRFLGSVDLHKVSGSLHITTSLNSPVGFLTFMRKTNFTHKIDRFTFGDVPPRHLQFPQPLSNSYEVSLT